MVVDVGRAEILAGNRQGRRDRGNRSRQTGRGRGARRYLIAVERPSGGRDCDGRRCGNLYRR